MIFLNSASNLTAMELKMDKINSSFQKLEIEKLYERYCGLIVHLFDMDQESWDFLISEH